MRAYNRLDRCARFQVPSSATDLLRADDTEPHHGLRHTTGSDAHCLETAAAIDEEAGAYLYLPCRLLVGDVNDFCES